MAPLTEIDPQADIDAKQRSLEEAELLLALYRALIEAANLQSGLGAALEIVCQFTGWAVGTAWLPAEDESRLRLHSFWHRDDPKLDEFIDNCRQQQFARDVGIPGRVWQRGKGEWTDNLMAEPAESSSLAPAATKAGLETACAVPITHNHQVDGVLMFHARGAKEEDRRLFRVISRSATQLGFALQHKRTENELFHQSLSRRRDADLDSQVVQRTSELRSANDTLVSEARRSANWLEHLIATTQDAVVSIDRRGCIVLFNAAAERVFGYSANEIVGSKVNDLMAEPYAAEHDQYIARYEQTGEARAIGRIRTVEGRRKNGETFPLELSVTQVATAESEHVHYAAFIRDISEVRRGQAWLQSLIETTQDAVLSIDRQGRIVLFNPAAERIFGYARDQVIGQKVNVLMGEPYATEHDEYISRYEKTGEARAIGQIRTVTARRQNGELFPIELSVTEIAMDQDVHYAAFIRDISEKTRLQSQLVDSERLAAIGSTAAKIGHELANPLNGMSLTVQLLEQRLSRMADASGSHLAPTIKRLKDEISRLQKLVGEFATISRKEKYVFRPVNLAQLIDDVVDLQAPHLAQNRIEIRTSLAPDLPLMSIDGDKMKQALLNLVKNAGEAMPDGGRITIDAFMSDGVATLEITDTGEGIPLDIDAFEPFATTKKEGTGVGLVIVRQILTAHHGKISYRSKPGQGTTFRVELPQRL